MSVGFNLEPGVRVLVDGVELTMERMVPALRVGDSDDIQFVARTGRISIFTEEEFVDLYNTGKVRVLTRTERISDRLPDDSKGMAAAHRRLTYLRRFDANPVSKYHAPLQAFIDSVAAEIGDLAPPSTGSFRRWCRERGEPGNRKLREMANRHRPGPGRRLHPLAEQILATEMQRYWESPRTTPKEVWCRVVTEIDDRNVGLPTDSLARIPQISYTTVTRRCRSQMTYERARHRFGPREAARRFKAIKGSLVTDRLLDLAIMDHTEVDCWVIDEVTHQPIGRPRITFLIDACSRYPLGFHIGWKSAGLEAAIGCLRHALLKKSDLRSKNPEIEHEWLAYGQPREILVDQGLEFVGTSFEDICADLGMSIRFAPARTPEYKGQIERFIGTVNRGAFHRIQGSVPGKPQGIQALGIDPEKDAVFFLSELEALVTKWIVDVYARETHRTLNAAPAQVWQSRLKTDPIELCPDIAALNAACSKIVKRTLTRNGIELNNLVYRSVEVSDLLEDLIPRSSKRNTSAHGVEVKVKYQPDDLSHIFVWNEARGSYIELPCTQPEYAKGLSEHYHAKLREWARETNRAFASEVEKCRARVQLYELMDTIVADRVVERKRLQRLRHPERQIFANHVRLQNVSESDCVADPSNAVEVLIDPVRNRVRGDETHPRRLLKAKHKAKPKRLSQPAQAAASSVIDARTNQPKPLAAHDFAAEIAAARAEAEAGRD